MRSVIFDLDGTLADTSADLIAAANACFAAAGHGTPLDARRDAAVAFAGGRAMLRAGAERAMPGTDAEAWAAAQYAPLLDHYRAGIDVQTRLYPGVTGALDALRAAGFALGICTNKPVDLAELLLERLGLRGWFARVAGAGSLPVRKPDPAMYAAALPGPGPSFLLGDTVTDRDTARAAGVPVALVAFGPLGAGVAALAPDALLGHFDELPALAGRVLGAAG